MKKILALVLVMAVASFAAVTFQGVDNEDGTVTISYNAPIVGLALNVDGDVSVSNVSLPDFFDVFMDYAYEQGESYVYGAGNPIALQNEAGTASLPSDSFCISAGGLEDDEEDVVPASGNIVLTIAGYAELAAGGYDIVIDENSLRGGVVDYDGYVENNLPITVTITVGDGPAPEIALGDIDNDGWVSPDDVTALVGWLGANANPEWGYWIEATPETAALDIDQDGWISPDDVTALVGWLGANANPEWGYWYEGSIPLN